MHRVIKSIDGLLLLSGRALLVILLLSVVWVGYHSRVAPKETLLMGLRHQSGDVIDARWVPLSDMSPHLVRAVIAAEDTKFCAHRGFDMEQIKIALAEAERGGRLRGASTISQQTAKNVFLWPGRGFIRKGAEAWFTALMETMWPKRQILEAYLNVAEWGDGLFGAEAASQARFGKSAADLTATEAALLAAVLPNPHDWRVAPAGPYVANRSQTLRRRMAVVRSEGLDGCVWAEKRP